MVIWILGSKPEGGEINICLIEKENIDRKGSFILKILIGCFNVKERKILSLFFFFFLSLKLCSLSMLDEYVSEKNSG